VVGGRWLGRGEEEVEVGVGGRWLRRGEEEGWRRLAGGRRSGGRRAAGVVEASGRRLAAVAVLMDGRRDRSWRSPEGSWRLGSVGEGRRGKVDGRRPAAQAQ
jgi:hypothetical protein